MNEPDQYSISNHPHEILDIAILTQLRQYLTDQELESTLQEYFEDSKKLLDNLIDSASDNNLEEVIRFVHTLKGNSKTLGSTMLAYYCQSVENQLKNDGKLIQEVLNLQTFELLLKSFRTELVANGYLSN